jgi:hypothetical protein
MFFVCADKFLMQIRGEGLTPSSRAVLSPLNAEARSLR